MFYLVDSSDIVAVCKLMAQGWVTLGLGADRRGRHLCISDIRSDSKISDPDIADTILETHPIAFH